ncbi:MAG TPA: hypothetical protein VK970_13230 [Candidatus Methylacidiphilales bacterium]|nr:hypothetical protein [Candidatus Methylacidiphilales bacterium]
MSVLPNYHPIFFIGAVGCVISIIIHVFAAVLSMRFIRHRAKYPLLSHGPSMSLYVTTVVTLVFFLAHIIQIAVWALIFMGLGQFDRLEPAFYHSAVNYTTLGYGTMMEPPWHLLEPLEATAGILAFGISTAALSALLMRMMEQMQKEEEEADAKAATEAKN